MTGPQGSFAIVSDIHGNLEALSAVLKEIDEARISRIVCLGDIVGYGADFEKCVDLVADRCDTILCGNHDEAVIQGPVDFNPMARDVINYTRSVMKPALISASRKRFRWNFLKGLKKSHQERDLLFCHGSPRDPVKEYVMRTDVVFAPEKLTDIFGRIQGTCFIGHTHQPGVILKEPDFRFFTPDSRRIDGQYKMGQGKAIVNVGSVGQPRDSDNRASYAVIQNDTVFFKRVDYDYHTAMAKIEADPNINNNCAARLALGK